MKGKGEVFAVKICWLIAKSLFYSWLQRCHPTVLFQGDSSRREIALTFDDGPHPRDTPQVLSALAKHNVHATFFLIGQSVERYPQIVREIHQNGHQLALHCYHHLPFPIENPSMLRKELDHTCNVIADTCGISPEIIRDVRPPYGFFTAKTSSMLRAWEYRLVMWNSIPPHWMQPLHWTVKQILDDIVPGSVIVLHDGKGHGAKVVQIVNTIVPRLEALEFAFIRVANMR